MGSCEAYEALISAFIDGALGPEDQQRLMEHMAACPRCQAYFDDQIAIQDAMDRAGIRAPAGFTEAVMNRVRETPQEVPAGSRTVRLRPWRRWAAIAACCAVAALGLWSLQSRSVNQAADQVAATGYMARDASLEAEAEAPAAYRMVPEAEDAPEAEKEAVLGLAPMVEEPASMPEAAQSSAADSGGMEDAAPDTFSLFESLPERFIFCSGAGAWRTELRIAADGSFTGTYTDSNAGWEDHPAELYYCNFSGQFSEPVQVSEFVWSATVASLETEDPPGETTYVQADNLNRISSTPYGLENAGEVRFYLPGTAAEDLPESFRSWTRAPSEGAIPFFGLYNVEEGFGFSDYDYWLND